MILSDFQLIAVICDDLQYPGRPGGADP